MSSRSSDKQIQRLSDQEVSFESLQMKVLVFTEGGDGQLQGTHQVLLLSLAAVLLQRNIFSDWKISERLLGVKTLSLVLEVLLLPLL